MTMTSLAFIDTLGAFAPALLGGFYMKTLATLFIGIVIFSSSFSSAFALGGCGPNRHRNAWGACVWGGQNQAWCLRHTGHDAVRMPNGNLRCFR
jgi:hypothetical protein